MKWRCWAQGGAKKSMVCGRFGGFLQWGSYKYKSSKIKAFWYKLKPMVLKLISSNPQSYFIGFFGVVNPLVGVDRGYFDLLSGVYKPTNITGGSTTLYDFTDCGRSHCGLAQEPELRS